MVPQLPAETSTISCHSAAREGKPFISGQEDHGAVCFVQMCSLQKPKPSADLKGADQTIGAGRAHGARAAGLHESVCWGESSLRGGQHVAGRRTRAPAAAACGGADSGVARNDN